MQDRILNGLAQIEGWSTFYSEGVWGARYVDPGTGHRLEMVVAADGPRAIRTGPLGVGAWPDFWAGIDLIREVMRGQGTTEGPLPVPSDAAVP